MKMRIALGALLVTGAALVLSASAWAHARVSPPVVEAKQSQVFTLAVPTEDEGVFTTKVEMTPPSGFSIDSFVPSPGWKRTVQQQGSGEEAVVTKVTWEGGHVPTGEDAAFSFLATPNSSKHFTFSVRQTYSDGKVVDWSGDESSDTPAPVIEAKSSLGGGGSSLLGIIGLIVAVAALVVAILALARRAGSGGGGGGGRELA
jgi:uncharacterized protein YcnI